MLKLTVHDGERNVVLKFEHSLLSLSKWESRNKKAFLATPTKSSLEMIDYFQDMLLEDESPDMVYHLSPEQLDELSNYINDPMTASSVPQEVGMKSTPEIVTSELIYYWMVGLKINWQAETWHLNRLMMLIQITTYKNQPEKKTDRKGLMSRWQEMNAKNKEQFGTKG